MSHVRFLDNVNLELTKNNGEKENFKITAGKTPVVKRIVETEDSE